MIFPVATLSVSLLLAAILLTAASHKLRAIGRFARQLEAYDLLPSPAVVYVAYALPLLESVISILLLIPNLRAWGGVGAALLFSVYGGAISINLWRGRRNIDCGCSGPGLEHPLSRALVVRNAALACLSLLAAIPHIAVGLHPFGWFLVLACASSGLLLYTAIEGLLANQPRLQLLIGR